MKWGSCLSFFEAINSVDMAILEFIQNTFRGAFLDYIMVALSYMGEAGAIWIVAGVIMLFFKKTRLMGVMALTAMAVGYLIGELCIKNLVCRPRPFVVVPDAVLNIAPPSGYSFPSGHSCSSFAAATVIFLCNKRYGIPALVLASLIAFSRLYNFVHFPSDVFCGILLGIICALMTVLVYNRTGLSNKFNKLERTEQ